MLVVGISGSGRKNGNTAALVRAVLDGAKSAGAETRFIELGGLSIAPCDASRACKKMNACTIKDDMQAFYDLAPKVDLLVLGSPIYLDHITGGAMTFIQRLYCYIGADIKSRWPHPGTQFVPCITYGWDDPNGYDDVLKWMTERFEYYWNIPTGASFKLSAMAHSPIVAADHPEIVRARKFGAKAAK